MRTYVYFSLLWGQENPEDIQTLDSCEYIWEAGVGFAHSPPVIITHDQNRAEILKLIITCFSETMYLPPVGECLWSPVCVNVCIWILVLSLPCGALVVVPCVVGWRGAAPVLFFLLLPLVKSAVVALHVSTAPPLNQPLVCPPWSTSLGLL